MANQTVLKKKNNVNIENCSVLSTVFADPYREIDKTADVINS